MFCTDAHGGAAAGFGAQAIGDAGGFARTERAFALEGAVFIAGAAIQWLRDKLGIIGDAAESGELAQSVADTGGVYFVPAFVGLGAPHWDPEARGMIEGITACDWARGIGAGGAGGDCVSEQRTGGGDGGR